VLLRSGSTLQTSTSEELLRSGSSQRVCGALFVIFHFWEALSLSVSLFYELPLLRTPCVGLFRSGSASWNVSSFYEHTYSHKYMYIYMYVYLYALIHLYTYTYLCIHIPTYTCIYICIYVYVYIHIYVYMYIYIYVCMYLSLSISVSPPPHPHPTLSLSWQGLCGCEGLLESDSRMLRCLLV